VKADEKVLPNHGRLHETNRVSLHAEGGTSDLANALHAADERSRDDHCDCKAGNAERNATMTSARIGRLAFLCGPEQSSQTEALMPNNGA
jgi:hypothetical protein